MYEPVATAELSTDEQLDALFGTVKSKSAASDAAASPGKPIAGDKVPPVASPEAPETDPLLAALEAIEEEKPAEVKPDEKPAISDEQKNILNLIPNAEVLKNVETRLAGYENLTNLLSSGNFADVESEFTHWDKNVWDGLVEHIYEKNKEAFIDRFIAEAEGKGQTKEFKQLQKEVQTLKSSLEEKKTVNAQSEAQEKLNANFQAYNQHVDGLFEQIKFAKADRRYVTADLNARIAADPKVLAAIKNGNAKAVNPLFKAACREYLQRDKEVSDTTAAKVAEQEKKKLPLGGAAAEVQDELPENIKDVPKGKEDTWAKRQLDKLLAKKK